MLDTPYKSIEEPKTFPVHIGKLLQDVQKRVVNEIREKELGES